MVSVEKPACAPAVVVKDSIAIGLCTHCLKASATATIKATVGTVASVFHSDQPELATPGGTAAGPIPSPSGGAAAGAAGSTGPSTAAVGSTPRNRAAIWPPRCLIHS